MTLPFKNILRVAIIVGLILLIPLVLTIRDGGVEGVGWNWTAIDFVVMGSLLFVTGIVLDLVIRTVKTPLYRAVGVVLVVGAFLVIWAQMAVGAVSQLLSFLFG